MKIFLRCIVMMVMLSGTWALAQPASTQPADDRGRRGRLLRDLPEVVTTQESEELEKFMKENSPHRWEAMQRLPQDGPGHKGVMRMALARFRNLESLRDDDKVVYDLRVQILRLEDEMFGLVEGLREADRQAKRTELRAKAAEIVKLTYKERTHRIEKLEKQLQAERERITQDMSHREESIDQRVEQVIRQGGLGIRPPEPPRGAVRPEKAD